MTWKHPHSPVKEVQDSAVSRENDGHCFLGCLWSYYVGWFHASKFNSKCSCLSGNSKQTQRGYLGKRPGCWPKEFLLCNTVLNLTVLLQLWIFWTHESGRLFHIHQAVLICCVRLPSVPRDEKAPPRSVLPLHWICSKRSQELLTCLVHIFVHEELDKLICHYDTCLNRLCDCVA